MVAYVHVVYILKAGMTSRMSVLGKPVCSLAMNLGATTAIARVHANGVQGYFARSSMLRVGV